MWDEFTKVYKNAKLNYVNVNSADYLKKIQASLAAGTDLPDLLLGEMGSRGPLLALDIWDNLLAAPYNVDTSKLMDFCLPLGSNAKGELCGVDNLMCPAGIAYKADLAKQYFGTDDPQQLHDLMSDWNTFIAKGKEVTAKSNGKVFMFPCIADALSVVQGQMSDPVLQDGKFVNIDKIYGSMYQVGAAMRDAGILDKLGTWSPAWNASFKQNNHIFYPCASWGPQYVIQPNDKDSKGRWRVMIPPGGGYYSGGTIWGVWKNSKVKDITWGYINWTIFGDGANVYREKLGYFVPRKDMYAQGQYDYSNDGDPYFGGENIKQLFFSTIAATVKPRPITQYDSQLNDVNALIMASMEKDTKVTADKALQSFKDELKKKVPDVEIAN
jgi:ABC-type sugar transport system, periplasmic component